MKIYAVETVSGGLERNIVYVGQYDKKIEREIKLLLNEGFNVEMTVWENGIKIETIYVDA